MKYSRWLAAAAWSLKMRLLRDMGLVLVTGIALTGCDAHKSVIPDTAFTDEQNRAIMAEDAAVEAEESQGNLEKSKKTVKR
jgi:hypothetical protein